MLVRFVALTLFVCSTAFAADKAPAVVEGTRTSPNEIAAILAAIPVAKSLPDKHLGDRLLRLNIDVKMVNVGVFTADDVQSSRGLLRSGDVDYMFTTSTPSEHVLKDCSIGSSFTLTRRGHLWIPSSRTANFLLNGPPGCRLP